MRTTTIAIVAMAAVVGLLTMQTTAADWPQQAKLTASDAAEMDYFGISVSISGDYALVGAHGDDIYSGSAYIFKRDGTSWTEQAKLVASDAVVYFGHSVSISGDYALVGAYGEKHAGSNSGSAYIFKRNGTGWTQQAKLTASDAAAWDEFGASVSISGDYAVVGARYDGDGGDRSGSAYIFKRNGTGWSQQAKLTASDAAMQDYFGWSVSISGDYAVVGANYGDGGFSDSGSAYIFKRDGTGWSQQDKLTASDAALQDYFGWSVSISGDYAIVGASGDDDGGSAYIFKRDGTNWTEQDKITASDAAAHDYFGRSVSISGDCALVGAYHDDDGGSDSGSAYIFKRDGEDWTEEDKLTASDAARWDEFGNSVSIDDGSALVGAHGNDDAGDISGSAYVFVPEPATLALLALGGLALLRRRRS